MGIFSRRQQAVAVATRVWQPDPAMRGDEVYTAPAAEMYDDGCAGDAYGAEFVLQGAPASSIRVWAYPARVGGALTAPFEIGYRIEYRVFTAHGSAPWLAALYGDDGPEPDWFWDLDAASSACHIVATALARTTRTEATPDPLQCFDWDGEPW